MPNIDPFIYSQLQAAANTADPALQEQSLYWIARRSNCIPESELFGDGRLSQAQKIVVFNYLTQKLADLAMALRNQQARDGGAQR